MVRLEESPTIDWPKVDLPVDIPELDIDLPDLIPEVDIPGMFEEVTDPIGDIAGGTAGALTTATGAIANFWAGLGLGKGNGGSLPLVGGTLDFLKDPISLLGNPMMLLLIGGAVLLLIMVMT